MVVSTLSNAALANSRISKIYKSQSKSSTFHVNILKAKNTQIKNIKPKLIILLETLKIILKLVNIEYFKINYTPEHLFNVYNYNILIVILYV